MHMNDEKKMSVPVYMKPKVKRKEAGVNVGWWQVQSRQFVAWLFVCLLGAKKGHHKNKEIERQVFYSSGNASNPVLNNSPHPQI